MTRYLLDTNIISEIRKPKPHGAVVKWFDGLRDEQICLSAVTLGELQEGIERTRKQDAAKAGAIEAWVNDLENSSIVLPMDARCFREMARMTSSVSSGLQSLTKMISKSMFNLVKVALSRSYMIGMA